MKTKILQSCCLLLAVVLMSGCVAYDNIHTANGHHVSVTMTYPAEAYMDSDQGQHIEHWNSASTTSVAANSSTYAWEGNGAAAMSDIESATGEWAPPASSRLTYVQNTQSSAAQPPRLTKSEETGLPFSPTFGLNSNKSRVSSRSSIWDPDFRITYDNLVYGGIYPGWGTYQGFSAPNQRPCPIIPNGTHLGNDRTKWTTWQGL